MASNTRSNAGKSKSGPAKFQEECGCLNHDIFTEKGTIPFKLRRVSWFKGRTGYSELLARGLLHRKSYICTACIKFAVDNFTKKRTRSVNVSHEPEEELDSGLFEDESAEIDEDIDMNTTSDSYTKELVKDIRKTREALENLKWEKLSADLKLELTNLAGTLGKIVNLATYKDGQSINDQYKDLRSLGNMDLKNWLSDRNPVLINFLYGCSGVNEETDSNKKTMALVHAIEQILYARNLLLVTPFAFQRNLISYSLTNSKTAVKLNGSWESSGGYTTINKVITAPCPPNEYPRNDVENTIDNNQKVGKHSGRIREGSKVPISICTTVGHIVPKPETNLQNDESLMPKNWLDAEPLAETMRKVETFEQECLKEFRLYRGAFIKEGLKNVEEEQRQNGSMHDYVDIGITNDRKDATVCSKCCHVYPQAVENQLCPRCKHNPSYYDSGFDVYYRTPSMHPQSPPLVSVGEPLMENPDSYEAVKHVLNHVRKLASVGYDRKWTSLHSDGVPYVYASNLQDNLYLCNICSEEVRKEDREEHSKGHSSAATYDRVFGDIVLRPGPGHIEMNMAKKLLKVCWEPFLSTVAKGLGFRTPRAQDVFKNGVDHHRSRQVLEVSLQALSSELLLPYVRECLSESIAPTGEGYQRWVQDEVEDDTYMFLYHVTFSYLLAFHLYTEATRKNHSRRMMAARVVFAPLFFVGHHPKYQVLHLRDLCNRVQYPPLLKAHVESTESFSVSGVQNRGQGADFIHEETNRLVKSFLPPGMPTEETWLRVCRKASDLRAMKNSALAASGFSEEDSAKRPKKFDSEVLMSRKLFRANSFIASNPRNKRAMKSVSGAQLDYELCDIKTKAIENYEAYKVSYTKTGMYGQQKLPPLFITPADREQHNKIENKTKVEIKALIREILKEMPDRDIAKSYINDFNKKEKRLKHADCVELFYELKTSQDEQIANVEIELEHDE